MTPDITTHIGALKAPSGSRIAIVYSRFNSFIVDRLLKGAVDCLAHHGIEPASIVQSEVPGAWELPWVAGRFAKSGKVDAIIALGAVIRGGTPHFEYVAGEASTGLRQVMVQTGIPIGFGLLTTDNVEQAQERSGTAGNNKGWDTALTVIELLSLSRTLDDHGL